MAGTLTDEEIRAADDRLGTEPDQGNDSAPEVVESEGQFAFLVGGKAVTTESIRLYGGAIDVEPPEGGFKKGGHYVLEIETVCHKVSYTDQRDTETQDVVGCRDERGLKITGVRFVEQV